MSTPNAETVANQSFKYIDPRFQNADFLSLFSGQFGKIEDVQAVLECTRKFVFFFKNLIFLQENNLIDAKNEFWIDPENDEGIYRVISTAESDIHSCREMINGLDARLLNGELALFDLDTAVQQLDLINALIYQREKNQRRMSIESLSDYRLIFQSIYFTLDKLCSEFTVLHEAVQQISEPKPELFEAEA